MLSSCAGYRPDPRGNSASDPPLTVISPALQHVGTPSDRHASGALPVRHSRQAMSIYLWSCVSPVCDPAIPPKNHTMACSPAADAARLSRRAALHSPDRSLLTASRCQPVLDETPAQRQVKPSAPLVQPHPAHTCQFCMLWNTACLQSVTMHIQCKRLSTARINAASTHANTSLSVILANRSLGQG